MTDKEFKDFCKEVMKGKFYKLDGDELFIDADGKQILYTHYKKYNLKKEKEILKTLSKKQTEVYVYCDAFAEIRFRIKQRTKPPIKLGNELDIIYIYEETIERLSNKKLTVQINHDKKTHEITKLIYMMDNLTIWDKDWIDDNSIPTDDYLFTVFDRIVEKRM